MGTQSPYQTVGVMRVTESDPRSRWEDGKGGLVLKKRLVRTSCWTAVLCRVPQVNGIMLQTFLTPLGASQMSTHSETGTTSEPLDISHERANAKPALTDLFEENEAAGDKTTLVGVLSPFRHHPRIPDSNLYEPADLKSARLQTSCWPRSPPYRTQTKNSSSVTVHGKPVASCHPDLCCHSNTWSDQTY